MKNRTFTIPVTINAGALRDYVTEAPELNGTTVFIESRKPVMDAEKRTARCADLIQRGLPAGFEFSAWKNKNGAKGQMAGNEALQAVCALSYSEFTELWALLTIAPPMLPARMVPGCSGKMIWVSPEFCTLHSRLT